MAQIVAVGGHLVFGLVLIWLFGREFSDRTAKDLLALPTSRAAVVAAKFTVAVGWCLLLVCQLLVMSLLIGGLLRLPGWSAATVMPGLGVTVGVGLLTAALATTYGLVASWGRGYLAAVGVMFAIVFASQVISAVGYGAWFPWAIPSLLSGVAGPDQSSASVRSLGSVAVVGSASGVATLLWWQRADHDR